MPNLTISNKMLKENYLFTALVRDNFFVAEGFQDKNEQLLVSEYCYLSLLIFSAFLTSNLCITVYSCCS